jgi:GNAT superfamily N-acetyltransferase
MRASEFTNFTYKTEPYEGWNGDGLVVRAYDGSTEVGHVIFEPTEGDNTQWYAVDVEVEEPYQRKGIASKMYDIAKKIATQQGAIIVKSHTQTDAGRGLWQDKLVWEAEANKTTLNNIYDGDYPDEDELIWNFVGNQDFDVPFTVKTLNADTLKYMLLDTYGVDELKDLFRKMQPDQKATIEYYKNDPNLSNHIIVVNKNIIVDGNHRALAAVLANKNIKCVDVSEEPIDEADSKSQYAHEISLKLQDAGYKKLGMGADATVWAKDDSYIIKILMPDDPNSQAEKVFQKFYEFCQQHSKLSCLPKFHEINTIDIGGKDYTQIEMEKLTPIVNNTFEEAMVWALSDTASKNLSWDNVVKELLNPNTWYGGQTRVMRKMPMFVTQRMNSPEFNKTYSQLYEVMRQLYQTGQINKFGWDLHTENVMQRSNGQLVIIDPWFIATKGSR